MQNVNQFNAVILKSAFLVLIKNRADILLVSYWIYFVKISAGEYDCENNGIFLRGNRIWNLPVYDCLMFIVLYFIFTCLLFIDLYFIFTCLLLFNVHCFIFYIYLFIIYCFIFYIYLFITAVANWYRQNLRRIIWKEINRNK